MSKKSKALVSEYIRRVCSSKLFFYAIILQTIATIFGAVYPLFSLEDRFSNVQLDTFRLILFIILLLLSHIISGVQIFAWFRTHFYYSNRTDRNGIDLLYKILPYSVLSSFSIIVLVFISIPGFFEYPIISIFLAFIYAIPLFFIYRILKKALLFWISVESNHPQGRISSSIIILYILLCFSSFFGIFRAPMFSFTDDIGIISAIIQNSIYLIAYISQFASELLFTTFLIKIKIFIDNNKTKKCRK